MIGEDTEMGSIFAVKILMSWLERPVARPASTELAPIRPGAWAAWSLKYEAEQAAQTHHATGGTGRVGAPLARSPLAQPARDGRPPRLTRPLIDPIEHDEAEREATMIALRSATAASIRGIQSAADYAAVARVMEACREADGGDFVRTADQVLAS
jgi:hypothetical protein